MSSASSSQHINRTYTSLELLGGRDCGDFRVNPDLTVGGGALINKSLCVKGSITGKGDLITQGNLSVLGNEIVYGDLTVYGNTTITGNVHQVIDLGKVKISSLDKELDYLDAKLVAGTDVTLTTIPGVSEQLRIDVVESGKVRVTAGDSLDYLSAKLVAGNAITLTTLPGVDEQIRIDGVPTSTLLENVVFVAKNGNDATADGSVDLPFLTVQAAMQYAYTTYVVPVSPQPYPGPYTRPTVYVCAGTYDDGDLVLPPQICVQGQGYQHTQIHGNWTIDTRWSNYSPPIISGTLVPNDVRSSWINLGLYGLVNVDFDINTSNEGKLTAIDVRFVDAVTVQSKLPNPVSNIFEVFGGDFASDVTLLGITTTMYGTVIHPGATLYLVQQLGDGVCNIFQSEGGSIANISLTAQHNPGMSPGPAYACTFGHSVAPGAMLTLNGAYSTVEYNANALPLDSLITFLGGATAAQLIPVNHADGCWSYNGDAVPSVKYIGTNTNFDFPINTNGVEVARFSTDARLFMGAPMTLHGSGSGVQYSSTVASRAQYRVNQYGNATGVPGISTFKSRGATIGSLAPVQVGDVIFRDTAVGVTDNLSIPLSGMISVNVTSVPVGAGYIGTEYEIQLTPDVGPANSRRPVFKVNGYGWPRLLEPTSTNPQSAPKTPPSGIATLAAQTASITNVSGSGTVVTYTAANSYTAGQTVTITGVNPGSYNLVNVLIATASATQFTVNNAAGGAFVAGGTATVAAATIANIHMPANGRVLLTVQPPNPPLGTSWVSNITTGDDVSVGGFTISSTNTSDVGLNVYYQLWYPL